VYAETLKRRHYAPLVGQATLFRIFLFLVAVVVSIVVAFATGGFWVKLSPTMDQPTVHYTYDALLLFEASFCLLRAHN
jgi:transmembrane protein 231